MSRCRLVKRIGIFILCAAVLCGCGRGNAVLESAQGGGAVESASAGREEMSAAGEDTWEREGDAAEGSADRPEGQSGTESAGAGSPSGMPGGDENRSGQTAGEDSDGTGDLDGTEPSDSEVPERQQITLVMVGDVLLHTPVAESGKKEEGGYDFTALFSHVKEEISQADLALVNQEVIIGGAELGVSGYPAFNAPYELGDALADAGFDVILHATNHALDKGKKGIVNCLAFWEENYPGEAVLGIYGSEEDSEDIYVFEQDGIRIAILNYTYGTNGIALPKDMPYAVDLLEEEQVAADLRRAEELADFTIVCPHWGTEYALKQTKTQERWARLFAENGADLVIGTHPHVIEPVEWVENTLVYYSLGNFVNWTSGRGEGVANRMVGGMARVTIVREEGVVEIADWSVEPLVCHVEKGFGGVTVYPLEEYGEELSGRNEIVKQDPDFSLEYCLRLVDEVFGEAVAETGKSGGE